ncbi:MAG TPA: hypothetical protein VGX92_11040 [Pyrinomonadaceae bacterium]|nr:hypothetical protein [Pyrinomonadaceae bacterium]
MSKKIRLLTAGLLASLAMTALMLSGPAALGVRAQGGAVAPTNAKSAAVAAATTAVLQETSEIRKLAVLRPVKSGAQSRAEIERMIMKNLDEDTTPEEMHAAEAALKKLGLVPRDFQYRPFIVSLLTEQVAGYYDPKAQEFYLADWIDVDGQKPVIAHELTHALQDQHFNLRRFEKWPKGDSDAELAAHALVEGDATLAMQFYIGRNPLRAIAMLRSIEASGSSSEQIDKAPRALRESLLFPYEKGLTWVTSLFKRGGWERVSQAFTDLPQSTEQVMHVEKYFSREAPVKMNLPDIASALGQGWKRIDYDVNGEWSFYLILDEYLKAATESERAAGGWGGDRYAVYESRNGGEIVISQITSWDTEKDALEFFDAYAKRTARRYPGATPTETADDQTSSIRGWRTAGEGTVVLERRGARVLILEGLPEKANARALLQTIWQKS